MSSGKRYGSHRPVRFAGLGAATGWVVFLATSLVVRLDPPSSIDHDLQGQVSQVAPAVLRDVPWLRSLSLAIARLGSAPIGVAVVLAIGITCAWGHRSWLPGQFLGVAYLGTLVSVTVTKRMLHRPGPYQRVTQRGRSFRQVTALRRWSFTAASRPCSPSLPAPGTSAVRRATGRSSGSHRRSNDQPIGTLALRRHRGLALGVAWLGTSGLVTTLRSPL